MKFWKAVFLSMLICIVGLSGVNAQTEGQVVIRGSVVNRTPGGAVPVNIPVTLQFFADAAWTSIYTSTLQTDGTFVFTGLEDELNHDFVTRVVYADVEYYSEPALLEGPADVEILIFESTDDAASIRIDQAHYFIVPELDGTILQVAEYYLIGNGGDKTYAGVLDANTGMRTTVQFVPPADAARLSFDGPGLGERYVGDDKWFADTRAVPPGSATVDVSYTYELAVEPDLIIDHVMDIPISSVVMIVSGGELGLEGTGLQFTGMMETQMGPAASYTAGPLAAHETLSFTLVPLPVEQTVPGVSDSHTEPVQRQRNTGLETTVGTVALVFAALGAYQLWKIPAKLPMPEEARTIVQQIAELDHRYEHGEIDLVPYQAERKNLVRQVRPFVRK